MSGKLASRSTQTPERISTTGKLNAKRLNALLTVKATKTSPGFVRIIQEEDLNKHNPYQGKFEEDPDGSTAHGGKREPVTEEYAKLRYANDPRVLGSKDAHLPRVEEVRDGLVKIKDLPKADVLAEAWYSNPKTWIRGRALFDPHLGRQICGAMNRFGHPCKNTPIENSNGRCKFHGGRAAWGPANPQWVSGKYSAYIPIEKLRTAYAQNLEDTDLMSLRDDIALNTARIQELLEELEEEGHSQSWMELKVEIERAKMADPEGVGLDLALDRMETIINQQVTRSEKWEEIERLQEHGRRMMSSETRMIQDSSNMITAEEALTIIFTVVDIVRRNVSNPSDLVGISNELVGVIPRIGGQGSVQTETMATLGENGKEPELAPIASEGTVEYYPIEDEGNSGD